VGDWFSVTQLSKTLGIPETTTRRYLNNFEEFFRYEQIGRGKKYHPDAVEVLQKIATLYGSDRETEEIKVILADEYAFSITEDNQHITTHPPTYNVAGKLDEFQKRQEDFNKELLKQLYEQQNYIQDLTEKRQQELEETKQLNSPEIKRAERFEQIMAERKITRILEDEALALWKEKPIGERMTKVGWFRKIEDRDKRESFVKKYIDENFEECLKKEFDI